jgi:hypothetical protein
MSSGSRWDLFPEDGTNNRNQTLSSLNSTDPGSLIDLGGYVGGIGPTSVQLTVDSGYYAGRLLEDSNQPYPASGTATGFGGSLVKDGHGFLTLEHFKI